MSLKKITHFQVYYIALILLAINIPVSVFGTSVVQFILVINWIIEGRFKEKWSELKRRKSILIFLLIYGVHLIGMSYTSYPEGFSGKGYTGLDDLRIKLPLLILPVIIGTSQKLNLPQIKTVMLFFSATVLTSTFISTGVLLGVGNMSIIDIRDISLFISHIRFSLFINISIFTLGYFLFTSYAQLRPIEKYTYPIVILWFVVFLLILKSLTGIAVLIICSLLFITYRTSRFRSSALRVSIYALLITIPLVISSYMAKTISRFLDFDEYKFEELDKTTLNGNAYVHNLKNIQVENGHWVGLYLCKDELAREWNKRSEIDYEGYDQKGQRIKYTMIRYLTSRNLRKDSLGVNSLSEEDIAAIEAGHANYIFTNTYSLYPRIYETMWEVDLYFRGGNPSYHSLSQRLEYLNAGFRIIKNNFWFGVGTGDVRQSFMDQYDQMNSKLDQKSRRRAHNQLVTFFITFGLIGFTVIVFAMIYPVFLEKKQSNFFFILVFLISIISMFNEDTLETQPGVTMFTFFYCLFLFGTENMKESRQKEKVPLKK